MRMPVIVLALGSAVPLACDGGATLTSTSTLAQSTDNQDESSANTALLITGGISLGLLVVGTTAVMTGDDGGDFSYLQQHQQDIRVALARGDGPFVSDTARDLALPPDLVPHLGLVLHNARPDLDPLIAETPLDKASARAFAKTVVAAIASDPLLAPALERCLAIASSAAR